MILYQSLTKVLGIHFDNSIFKNNDWSENNDHFHNKKSSLGQSETLSEKKKVFVKTVVYRSNICHFKIHKKKLRKEQTTSSIMTKRLKSKVLGTAFHLEGNTRHFERVYIVKPSKNKIQIESRIQVLSGKISKGIDCI